ncbi:uncharacterized protein LOC113227594 [Hyposmocoma kahamanoa]|uniref:uncharacterized protein LOC113227594 n=1 Tax=Hyposmocoma kahamanoa TaxID=1477025 RepID=UPI000E6D5B5A|nr:uncharacterized protein LOC113227594 [Hyposmocoma kahamanoa]
MQVSSQAIRQYIRPQIIAPAYAPQLIAPACAPQIIAPACPPQIITAPAPIVPQPIITKVGPPSVAENLADTLSLLTVSSLLAETLPLGYNNVIGVPTLPTCGCGCGYPNIFI